MGITVNGVSLIEILKKRQRPSDNKLSPGRKNSNKNKKNTSQLTPSTSRGADIRKFLQGKKEDNNTHEEEEKGRQRDKREENERQHAGKEDNVITEDNRGCLEKFEKFNSRKKTFVNSQKGGGFQTNLDKFVRLSEGVKCLIANGYCNTHNVKVMREVTVKKMSIADDKGKVTWPMREVTILVCPASNTRLPGSSDTAIVKQVSEIGTTNGKQPKFRKTDVN